MARHIDMSLCAVGQCGGSTVGGRPVLPDGAPWPTRANGTALGLVARIQLDELPWRPGSKLPRTGTLDVFYDNQDQDTEYAAKGHRPSGLEDKHLDGAQVLYHPEPQKDAVAGATSGLCFRHKAGSANHAKYSAGHLLGGPDKDYDTDPRWWLLQRAQKQGKAPERDGFVGQLVGWRVDVQAWPLLIQLDHNEGTGPDIFGRFGRLMVFLRRDAWRAFDVSRTEFVMESGAM